MYLKSGYDRNALQGYEMLPNLRNHPLPFIRTVCSTNSVGFRGAEEYGSKAPGEFRVALLGGSCMFGYGARGDDTTIAARLRRQMADQLPGRSCTVLNAAAPAYVSYQLLARLQLRVLPLHPDVAVFYEGWNDSFFTAHYFTADRSLFHGWDVYFQIDSWGLFIERTNRKMHLPLRGSLLQHSAFVAGARRLIETYVEDVPHHRYERVRILPNGPIRQVAGEGFRDNLVSFVAICRAHGIHPVLVTLVSDGDSFVEDRVILNGVIRKVAGEQGAVLVDLDAIPPGDRPAGMHDATDHYHFTDSGNAWMAERLAEAIVRLASPETAGQDGR